MLWVYFPWPNSVRTVQRQVGWPCVPRPGLWSILRETLGSSAPTALDSPCLLSALLCMFTLKSLRTAFSTRNLFKRSKSQKNGNFYICINFQDVGVQGILLSCECFTSHRRTESFMVLLRLCCHWAFFFINALSSALFPPSFISFLSHFPFG